MSIINLQNKIHEVGNSMNSINLEYAEITKYFDERKYRISHIKFYYSRIGFLVSIQYIFKEKNKEDSYISPKNLTYFGPEPYNDNDINVNSDLVEEITLSLEEDEQIYQINGFFDEKKNYISKMLIETNKGNFIQFGIDISSLNIQDKSPFNFKWNFFFNGEIFNGFVIGWNNKFINHLAIIILENKLEEEKNEEKKDEEEELEDVTYKQNEYIENILNPISQSIIFGTFNSNQTVFRDCYINNPINLLEKIRKGKIYLSKLSIFYTSKYINRIKVTYSYFSKEKNDIIQDWICRYFNSSKDIKEVSINLNENEYIKEFSVICNDYIEGLIFKSNNNKILKCICKEGEKVKK